MNNKEAIKWLNKNRPCIYYDCDKDNAVSINIATNIAIKALKGQRPWGEWIPNYTCPICGEIVKFPEDFCPQCKTDMRGEEHD